MKSIQMKLDNAIKEKQTYQKITEENRENLSRLTKEITNLKNKLCTNETDYETFTK